MPDSLFAEAVELSLVSAADKSSGKQKEHCSETSKIVSTVFKHNEINNYPANY